MKATVVVPCKGRLMHLQQTVPLFLEQEAPADSEIEVLVVDYGCPEDTLDWVQSVAHERLNCVRVLDRTHTFNLSRARNCGNRLADGKGLTRPCDTKKNLCLIAPFDPFH